MGETGPCGPCSEIHFDRGPDPLAPDRAELVNGEGDDIIEIWNLVFMQFNRDAEGKLHPLPRPSIDTGAGLERIATVLQGVETNYDTDLFVPLLEAIGKLVERPFDPASELAPAYRVIADHIRASAFLLTDGVVPSNEGRGYVLRRIIRRALRYGRKLGLDGAFLHTLLPVVNQMMGEQYPELIERHEVVATQLEQEERRFARTLNAGTDIAGRELERLKRSGKTVVPGRVVFDLYQTHGIPSELIEEFAQEEGLTLDHEGFEAALKVERERGQASWKGDLAAQFCEEHQDLADAGIKSTFDGYERLVLDSKVIALIGSDGLEDQLDAGDPGEVVLETTPFFAESGGQAGDTGEITVGDAVFTVTDTRKLLSDLSVHVGKVSKGSVKSADTAHFEVQGPRRDAIRRNHTATHLMHTVLRSVLGEHVKQAGSQVDAERLRFDFSHHQPVSVEEKAQIEAKVNAAIWANGPVDTRLMTQDEAIASGAMALFGEKYGDEVRVVSAGFSTELCGGTHVARTGDIGPFRIVSEAGIAAGVRRIEAVTGESAYRSFVADVDQLGEAAGQLKVRPFEASDAVAALQARLKEAEKELTSLKGKQSTGMLDDLIGRAVDVDGVKLLTAEVSGVADFRDFMDKAKGKLKSGVIVFGMKNGPKVQLIAGVTKDLTDKYHAGNIVREVAIICGGRGGGKADMAMAGGTEPDKLKEALASVSGLLKG